jgi:hypothetical protein
MDRMKIVLICGLIAILILVVSLIAFAFHMLRAPIVEE